MSKVYMSLLTKALNGHGVKKILKWIGDHFVRKEDGKGLSEENYTATDKQRVTEAVTKDELEETIFENDEFILNDDEINRLLGVAESAEDFVALLAEGDVVTLGADIALGEGRAIEIGSDTTIELNGHTITGAAVSKTANLFSVTGAKLAFKGSGNLNVTGRIAVANEGGEIEIEGGSFASNDVAFTASTGGKVTMNGGEINAVEGGIIAPSGNGEIVMNKGTVSVSDNFAIGTNGSSGRGGNVITINGGTLIGSITSAEYEAIGVYVANSDTLIMNGGTIQAIGGAGLCMRAGAVTINGGEIVATSGDHVPGYIGDKKQRMYASAIIYDFNAAYPGRAGMCLTINDGVFTGADHSLEVLSDEMQPQVTVNGGTFTPVYPEA